MSELRGEVSGYKARVRNVLDGGSIKITDEKMLLTFTDALRYLDECLDYEPEAQIKKQRDGMWMIPARNPETGNDAYLKIMHTTMYQITE